MDDARAQAALNAYRKLIRVARHPERDPAYPMIMADLADAELFYRGIEPKSSSQHAAYQRIRWALHH